MLTIATFFLTQLYCLFRGIFHTPAFLFVGYIVIYFMYHEQRWWSSSIHSIGYSFFFSLVIIICALIPKNRTPTSIFQLTPLKWFLAVLAYFAVVQFWAVLPGAHSYALENFIKVSVVFLAAFKLCKSPCDLDKYLLAFTAGCAYIGFYVMETGRNGMGRVEGVGTVDSPDVNDMAAVLAVGAIFCLHYFWHAKNNKQRILILVAGGLIVNALVLMNSRGSFVGVVAGSCFYLIGVMAPKVSMKYKKTKVTGLILFGLIGLVSVLDEQAINRFLSIKSTTTLTEEQESGSTRVFFWLAAADMAQDYPLGAGTYSFNLLSPQYIPESIATGETRNRAVHSIWFQSLAEVGYIGSFFFVMMLISAYILTRNIKKQALIDQDVNIYFVGNALQAACVSYLAAATFLDRFRAVALYMLLIFVCCAYNVYVIRKDTAEVSNKTV